MHYQVEARSRQEQLISCLCLDGAASLLDLGCGTGYFVKLVSREGLRVIGLDVDVTAIEIAKHYSAGQDFIIATATSIPIRDQAVNRILCTEVLEHVIDDSALMNECHRVLNKLGIFACSSPNADFQFHSRKTSHRAFGPEQHVRSGYSPRKLIELLVQSGFEHVSLTFALPLLGTLLVELLERMYAALYGALRTQAEMQRLTATRVFWLYKFFFPLLLLAVQIKFPRSFGGSILIARAHRR